MQALTRLPLARAGVLLVLTAAIGLSACGRRGDPLPPPRLSTTDATVASPVIPAP